MLPITQVDHIGIRIRDLDLSRAFYEKLGFEYLYDHGFKEGHPAVLRHPSGVVLNLLGPSNQDSSKNILMDVPEKYAGITHIALRVESLDRARRVLASMGIELSAGPVEFGQGMRAMFVRDPDRNVIELDENDGNILRRFDEEADLTDYSSHP